MVPVTAPVHRLSLEDVYRMVEVGVLDENDRVELVEGVLVDMVPSGPEHDGAIAWLNRRFARIDTAAWEVRVQSMLLVAGGYLVPDLTLVAPLPRNTLPTTAHLAVEIAQTSQSRDREKAHDYATADIAEYWIVDLSARSVIVHRRPLTGAYQEITTFIDGASIEPLLADAPAIDVTALLG
ncbi:MAG: Uma2 family endonuclease [Actinomycetota bacterium]|nr:Uma2 family endonuclease [Actinomycetota bacterium]